MRQKSPWREKSRFVHHVFHLEQRTVVNRLNLRLRGVKMDKYRVKGAIDEVVGSAKSHIGNLTGNIGTQAKGAVQQIKGKVETAFGKGKDACRDAKDCATAKHEAQKAGYEHSEVIVAVDRRPL
jgi:uncharacterized protein YjbJ (UPF0337 family)